MAFGRFVACLFGKTAFRCVTNICNEHRLMKRREREEEIKKRNKFDDI